MVINLIHSSALAFFFFFFFGSFFFLSDKYVQCPIGPGLLRSVLYIRENVLSMLKRLDKNVRFKNFEIDLPLLAFLWNSLFLDSLLPSTSRWCPLNPSHKRIATGRQKDKPDWQY